MIIKVITIIYLNDKPYNNFRDLFENKINTLNTDIFITFNTAPNHILPPNGSKFLLEITPTMQTNDEYFKSLKTIRDIIKDCTINIKYEDIFENEFNHNQNLSFLKNS